MSKHYRPWKIDDTQLLPASVQDYVPGGYLSRFIVALVRESLDLSEIEASYAGNLGQPPFHPGLMTALLLNGYAHGIYSSRRIEQAARERADFMMIVAGDVPDFRTISDFRKRHLLALARLFVQVLQLCAAAGLVKLGHVALDGTKIKANASKHKAMSYERMKKREAELQAEVDRWLAAAAAADAEEDKLHGARRGDELPSWVADKEKRLAKIRAAKAELEAEAKAAAQEERRRRAEVEEKRIAQGRKKNGFAPKPPSAEPEPQAQRNFTDPESRLLLTKDGYIQGWNAQAAVDGTAQVILAHGLTPSMTDHGQLVGLVDAVAANLGRRPNEVSADSGYLSEAHPMSIRPPLVGAHEPGSRPLANGPVLRPASGAMGDHTKRDQDRSILDDRIEDLAQASPRLPSSTPRLASEVQAAAHIGLDLVTFRAWVAAGRLPHALPDCGRYDMKAIHLALDRMSGIASPENGLHEVLRGVTRHKT